MNKKQIIYLDFDGAETQYNNSELNLNFDVSIKDSAMTEEQKRTILAELSAKYADTDIEFTIEKPAEELTFSTVYIGQSDDFAEYGDFAGLAETIDSGNKIKNDDAFVFADYTSSTDAVVSAITHEIGHIVNGETHGEISGYLEDYALTSRLGNIGTSKTITDSVKWFEADTFYFFVSQSGYYTIQYTGTRTGVVSNIRATDLPSIEFLAQNSWASSENEIINNAIAATQGKTVSLSDKNYVYVYLYAGYEYNINVKATTSASIYATYNYTVSINKYTSSSTTTPPQQQPPATTVTQPDLIISSFYLSSQEISTNESVTLYFSVNNIGADFYPYASVPADKAGVPKKRFSVSIYDQGTFLTSKSVELGSSWLKNETVSLTYTFSAGELSAGDHLLTLKISGVDEHDDSNNMSSAQELNVFSAGPDISQFSTASSDINGNGISDVMFQYTGGNYQLGFWMDGSCNWKSQNKVEPREWEVLGAYDMNCSGKADAVMVGNVTVNGIKGAFIGYYAEADTNDWRNISYLTNKDNINWKNTVGNLTGNAGQNSIVWHASDIGALGVWTDGTDNWRTIDGYYGAGWTLLGTGDFDGNGKDEVLLGNNGAFYSVDIDNKFTALANIGTGWEVCAVGDFSNDGRDDIIVFNSVNGVVAKLSDGKSWSNLGQLDAGDWFVVGAGEYNGYGGDDLLVRQYSSGMLGYYASGNMSSWNELGKGVDMNWKVIA